MKKYKICLDGIDKSGKDAIARYLARYDKMHCYALYSRGIISLVAYNKLFKRNYNYIINDDDIINVLLTIDYDDWIIRCKMTNEPDFPFDFKTHMKALQDAKAELAINYGCDIIEFNTSKMTPYAIAKAILTYADSVNDIDRNAVLSKGGCNT